MDVTLVELTPQPAAVVHAELPVTELPAFFDRAFHAVLAELERQGVAPAGPPFGLYPTMPTEVVVVEAGFPTSRPIAAGGDVVPRELPSGQAARTVHVGPFDTLDRTYGELLTWLAEHGLVAAGPMWEVYLSDPSVEPDPSTWRTEIVCPVASR